MYVCMSVCMYVCLSVCIYLCIYVSMYVCMYLCIYVSRYLRIYVSMYLRIYVCMYVCMYDMHCMHWYALICIDMLICSAVFPSMQTTASWNTRIMFRFLWWHSALCSSLALTIVVLGASGMALRKISPGCGPRSQAERVTACLWPQDDQQLLLLLPSMPRTWKPTLWICSISSFLQLFEVQSVQKSSESSKIQQRLSTLVASPRVEGPRMAEVHTHLGWDSGKLAQTLPPAWRKHADTTSAEPRGQSSMQTFFLPGCRIGFETSVPLEMTWRNHNLFIAWLLYPPLAHRSKQPCLPSHDLSLQNFEWITPLAMPACLRV